MTDWVLISALIRAFSPTVRDPSELIWPSILPSTTKSLEKRIVPLISTSELRTFLPLGLGELERGAECDGVFDGALVCVEPDGFSLLGDPGTGFSDSGFCPITF